MTIDERLEGLAQSVELLAHMHKATEQALRDFTVQTDRFEEFAKLVISNHEGRMRRPEEHGGQN
jgi:hypothetical protein